MTNIIAKIAQRLPRMWDWIVLTIALFALVAWVAPQQLNVVLYKSLLVSLAAVLTYWVDSSLFKRTTDRLDQQVSDNLGVAVYHGARTVARALMFLGCALGITLGL